MIRQIPAGRRSINVDERLGTIVDRVDEKENKFLSASSREIVQEGYTSLTIPVPPSSPCSRRTRFLRSTRARSWLMKSTPLLRAVRELATRRTQPRVYKHLTADTRSEGFDGVDGTGSRFLGIRRLGVRGTPGFPPRLFLASTACNGEKQSRALVRRIRLTTNARTKEPHLYTT